MSFQDSFWAKVNKTDSCWLWTGSINNKGYGRLSGVYAHRAAYELLVGPIPEGKELDHLCRVTHCVNPEHLEPVTHRENLLRGKSPAAIQAKITHCLQGHAYEGVNLYVRLGKRHCRKCMARYQRKFRAAMREGEYINGHKVSVRAENPRESWQPHS